MGRGQSVLGTRVGLQLTVVIVIANVVGAVVVLVLAAWVLPTGPTADPAGAQAANMALAVGYIAVAVPIGVLWGSRRFRRKPGDDAAQVRREREVVLYGPIRVVTAQATLWAVAAVLFAALNLQYGPRLGTQVGETILLGGIANCALVYLLTERILRETTARALRDTPSARRKLPGILTRSIVFWALGTGVPIVGLMLAGVDQLIYRDISGVQLGLIMVTVGGTALVSGFLVTVGAARAVADPVVAVRQGMRRVEEGDLGAHVPSTTAPSWDGCRPGSTGWSSACASGNACATSSAARWVATSPAWPSPQRRSGWVASCGAWRCCSWTSVGSTALAARCPPTEVVALLNRFFTVVVDVVEAHGGWINKFEGDAALAVFGAPVRAPRPGRRGARGGPGAGPTAPGGGAGGRRRDRGLGGRRGGGQRRLDAALRVHGDRRPGERGRAAHRVLQTAARAALRLRAFGRVGGPGRGGALGRSARRSCCGDGPTPPGSRCLRPGRSRRARR
jgi:adenylate cyclase